MTIAWWIYPIVFLVGFWVGKQFDEAINGRWPVKSKYEDWPDWWARTWPGWICRVLGHAKAIPKMDAANGICSRCSRCL